MQKKDSTKQKQTSLLKQLQCRVFSYGKQLALNQNYL